VPPAPTRATPAATFLTFDGAAQRRIRHQLHGRTESDRNEKCCSQTHCDVDMSKCVPNNSALKCEGALRRRRPRRARRGTTEAEPARALRLVHQARTPSTLAGVWAPRVKGIPHGSDNAWTPDGRPLTALLNAYVIPEGQHCFENGEPCQSFDFGTYLTNLTAQFFMTNGRDVYYISHPSSHLCLGTDVTQCGYLNP
jgi:hypothetical protein